MLLNGFVNDAQALRIPGSGRISVAVRREGFFQTAREIGLCLVRKEDCDRDEVFGFRCEHIEKLRRLPEVHDGLLV